MTLLRLGVIGTSAKENEHRLPLHPEHLPDLDADLRARITLEHGYGERFGVTRRRPGRLVAGFATPRGDPGGLGRRAAAEAAARGRRRDAARARCCGAGRTACRTPSITQLAIDRELTLIAFEAMNHWTRDGAVGLHVFHKNNELAGYCSVLHALELTGIDRRLRPPADAPS